MGGPRSFVFVNEAKYMIFPKFTGSEAVKNQISCLISGARLPHAIVLEGSEASGSLILARDIAAALVCKGAGEKPCGLCPACKKAAAASHPDIFEFVAKETPRSFPVSVVREIRKDAYVLANEADYKIYILGNASSMGSEAQNALLKTLEEPPAQVILILTVTSKTLLLDTVLSRSVVFTLDEAEQQYDEKIPPVARAVAQALVSGNEYALLSAISPVEGSRDGVRGLSGALTELFRAALVCSAGGSPLPGPEQMAEQLGRALTKGQLLSLLQTMTEIQNDLNRNANNTLVLTKLCYRLKQAVL